MNLLLMAWLSPAFPVGSFAYSHGLEWAHEAGDVHDAASLQSWLKVLADHGSLRTDSVLLALSYQASRGGDPAALAEIAELAAALAPSSERHLETIQQGNSLMRIARDAWPCAALGRLPPGNVAYPVALGVLAQGHHVPMEALLPAFGMGFISNLTSAAIRLGVIGQTDGQRVLKALMPDIEAAAAFAQTATLDDLGACAFRSDLSSLRHETQYTRIFRS